MSKQIWISSGLFSVFVLGCFPVLETRMYFPLLVVAGLTHVITTGRPSSRLTAELVLSQFLIILASLLAIYLYLWVTVGPVDGLVGVLKWHLAGNWQTGDTYVRIAAQILAFFAAVFALSAAACRSAGSALTLNRLLVVLLTAAAVYPICFFSLDQPLMHVSGNAAARPLFFASGFIAVEPALVQFLIVLACTVTLRSARTRTKRSR